MQGRTCKKDRNKEGMKSTYPAIEHGKKSFINVSHNSLPCLSFSPCSVLQQGSLGCFHPHLVSILFTGPPLYDFNFYRNFFYPQFIFNHPEYSCLTATTKNMHVCSIDCINYKHYSFPLIYKRDSTICNQSVNALQ